MGPSGKLPAGFIRPSFVRTVGNRFWLIDGKKLVELDGPEGFFASVAKAVSGRAARATASPPKGWDDALAVYER